MKKDETKKVNKASKAQDNLNVLLSALLITALIFTAGILTLTGKVREYSENENRYLAKKPKFSFASVRSGEFMQNTEDYLSDQFAARDAAVKLRTGIDVFFGKREINGVYIGKRHYLFEVPAAYHEKRITATVNAVNTFTEKNGGVRSYMAIAPNSTEILSAYMPADAPTQNQTEQIADIYGKLNGVQCIDLCTPLKAVDKPDNLYYKTDHHWTTAAAEIAFYTIAGEMGIDTAPYTCRSMAVTNQFQGTLASSSGIFSSKDTIYITVPEPEVKYTVTYGEEKQENTTVFDSTKLQQKSKYDVFFGGNFAQVRIDTEADTDRVLMVMKDSYANCLLPMLVPYFKSIVIIDPRYYTENAASVIEMDRVTDILWLYNADTFLNDTSIANLLGNG